VAADFIEFTDIPGATVRLMLRAIDFRDAGRRRAGRRRSATHFHQIRLLASAAGQ
jgi:hypothetical protein